MRKLIIVAAIAAAFSSAVTAQAVSTTTTEQTLRAQLLSCVILDEAIRQGIPVRALPTTRYTCRQLP